MDNLIDLIITRRSVREFKPDMLPQKDIEKIINAGLYAASGMNRQETIIIAVSDKKTRDELMEMNRKIGGWEGGFDPFYGAPVVLVVLAKKSNPTKVYDGSLVIGNLMLAAHSLGIGSCWIHRAKEEFECEEGKYILKSLNIPDEYEGIGHCILGYPLKSDSSMTPRKKNRVYFVN